MSVENYYNSGFQSDMAQLPFRVVPQVLKDILQDQDLVLFGGKNWTSVAEDLTPVAPHHRHLFVLCLLALVATDQCMQTHFKSHYAHWRAQTAYPKFGWVRFGLYNENPLKILSAAEKAGLLDVDATCRALPEFVLFFRQQIQDYAQLHFPSLTPAHFFDKFCRDAIFEWDEGKTVPALKQAILRMLQNQRPLDTPGDGHLFAA